MCNVFDSASVVTSSAPGAGQDGAWSAMRRGAATGPANLDMWSQHLQDTYSHT